LFRKVKILFLFIAFFALINSATSASDHVADSLYERAKAVMRTDYRLSKKLGLKSLTHANNVANEFYQVKSLFLLAYLENKMANPLQAADIYFNIISKQLELKNPESKKILLSAYKNLSYIVGDHNEHDLAHALNREAFLLASKEFKDTTLMLKYLRPELSIYVIEEDFLSCLKLSNYMLSTFKINDSSLKDEIRYFQAISHQHLGNTELAMVRFNDLMQDTSVNVKTKSISLRQTSDIYYEKGQYEKAIETAKKALSISEQLKDRTHEYLNYTVIASSYYALKDYGQSIFYYEKLIEHSETYNVRNNFKFEVIPKFIKVLSEIGDEERVAIYHEKYQQLMVGYFNNKEEFKKSNQRTNLALMKIKMKELVASRRKHELPNINANADSLFKIILGLTLMVIAAGSVYFFNLRRKLAIINDLKKIEIESNV
jgi:tetratricopeptide (TPR) repeat protein